MQLATLDQNSDSPSHRKQRQDTLLNLIRTKDLATQQDLARELRKRGIRCTQTTVSRDLLELAVTKMGGYYRVASDLPSLAGWELALMVHGVALDVAGPNLIVLKTAIGTAQTVAIELDRALWKQVVGTIAGDDTIFIAVRNQTDRNHVLNLFQTTLKRRKPS